MKYFLIFLFLGLSNFLHPLWAQIDSVGNGGNTFRINLELARQLAMTLEKSINIDQFKAANIDPEAKNIYLDHISQFEDALKTIPFWIISPTNGNQLPLYVYDSFQKVNKRVFVKFVSELNAILWDEDLSDGHSGLDLANLILHEAGHVLGFDATWENKLDQMVVGIILSASDKMPDKDPAHTIELRENEAHYKNCYTSIVTDFILYLNDGRYGHEMLEESKVPYDGEALKNFADTLVLNTFTDHYEKMSDSCAMPIYKRYEDRTWPGILKIFGTSWGFSDFLKDFTYKLKQLFPREMFWDDWRKNLYVQDYRHYRIWRMGVPTECRGILEDANGGVRQ